MKVVDRETNSVAFEDPDGDKIEFRVSPGGDRLVYSVNGAERPPSAHVRWEPGLGLAGIALPDIQKGFPIPAASAVEILGGVRYLANRAGIKCEIPDDVDVPDGKFGLPNEIANQMLSSKESSA